MPPKDIHGLSSEQARQKLSEVGPNILPEKPPPSAFSILLSQFKNPLVYVLLAAGIVTLLLKEIPDAAIIFFAVFLNTVLGFVQERRASKALQALKELIHPKTQVIRDGKQVEIEIKTVK